MNMQGLRTEAFAGHTPGPWMMDTGCIRFRLNPTLRVKIRGRSTTVALIAGADTVPELGRAGRANAALIAAAPALLADRDRWRKVADGLARAVRKNEGGGLDSSRILAAYDAACKGEPAPAKAEDPYGPLGKGAL
jgi:hypothetical protein